MNEDYTIGLDLGINNVGWSIVNNNTQTIEKCGVRSFTISDDASARRSARNVRRRLKRRDTRIKDTLALFKKIGFPEQKTIDEKLIIKRYKGIKEQISKQDIVNILCYLTTHRGYIPFGDEEVNFVDLKDQLPCEYYYDLYIKMGKYRALNQIVKNSDLEKEIIKLLEVQEEFYPELKTINEDLITIFKRKRKFWEGPGSTNSITPYGRFKNPDEVAIYLAKKEKNPNYEKYLFEDLIGKCEIAIQEKRAPKVNFYAEKFNFLNDFINLSVNRVENLINQNTVFLDESAKKYKFTNESIELMFQYCLASEKVNVNSMLKSLFGLTIKDVEGYRIDKSQKPEFSTMNYYRYITKTWKEHNLDDEWLTDVPAYNRVIYYLTVAPGIVEVLKMIESDEEINYSFSDEAKQTLKEIQAKLKKDNALNYHSLSEKVLVRAIRDMMRYQMNFMQVRKKLDYDKEAQEYFAKNYNDGSGKVRMTSKFIDDIIASPQVKKTLRQSIKVINAIIDEKGKLPKVIAIESTKEMNGKDKRLELQRDQAKNEKLHTKAREQISNSYGDDFATEKNIEKIMLWEEVNGQCPYCKKTIGFDDVMHQVIQVEHILPLSKSCDDSYDNKTIACVDCNKKKGNKTPYQYLNAQHDYENYKKRIKSLKDISNQKRLNFLYEEDIDKYQKRFFNRNLRDTAYATKELVHQIQLFNSYLDITLNKSKILTLSVPGQLTSNVRKHQNLSKDRDDGKYHHAVDASIVAGTATTPLGKFIIELQNNPKFFLNNGKEELEKNQNYIKEFSLVPYKKQLKEIDSDEKIKISYQVSKNPQGQLSNANIYKIIEKNGNYYRIDQVDNIYLADFSSKETVNLFNKLFDENDTTVTLLCYDNNMQLFKYLKEIYETRREKENPFVSYCIERNGLDLEKEKFDYLLHGIHVPSKKKNSPLIVKLRYYKTMTSPYLIRKKFINKKSNTLIAFYSLKQHCTKVYYNMENQKFVFLPVFKISVDQKTGKINNKDFYYQQLYNEYIGTKKVTFISNIYNGNWLEIQKKNGSIIGGEFEYFDITNKSIKLKNKKIFTVNDLGFQLIDFDVLGNRKNRLTFKVKQ